MIIQQGPYVDALDAEQQLEAEEFAASTIFYEINDRGRWPRELAKHILKGLRDRFEVTTLSDDAIEWALGDIGKLVTMVEWRIIRATTFDDEQSYDELSVIADEDLANDAGKDILRYFLSGYKTDLFAKVDA